MDFETTARYEIVIVATDANGEVADLSITISVGNEQEGATVYEITDNNGALSVALVDADPASTTYSGDPDGVVGDVDYQWFRINGDGTRTNVGTTGATTYTPPSADADLIHGVVITYTDPLNVAAGTETTFEVLTSSIRLTQDGSPTSSYTGSINEDRSADNLPTIAASVAGAPSGHTITYQFLHSDGTTLSNMDESGTFTLDSGSGEIDLNSTLNHETTPRYELTVRVTYDADGDSTTTNDRETRDVDVVINVGDVNEHAPELGELQIVENSGATAGVAIAALAGATTGDDSALAGTAAAEYIDGDAGDDTITSGGGADHILGGAGDDGITLSTTAYNVETIYYRFTSTDSGAWTT